MVWAALSLSLSKVLSKPFPIRIPQPFENHNKTSILVPRHKLRSSIFFLCFGFFFSLWLSLILLKYQSVSLGVTLKCPVINMHDWSWHEAANKTKPYLVVPRREIYSLLIKESYRKETLSQSPITECMKKRRVMKRKGNS